MKNSRQTVQNITVRSFTLSGILIKEQIKEPAAFFWVMLSPSVIFFFLERHNLGDRSTLIYFELTSWYYAYIASSVAFFGFSLYLVGRRESGYIRSFVYEKTSRIIFMLAHTLAYSLIAILYCTVFYIVTRPFLGGYDATELPPLVAKFYICFLLFSSAGLFLTLTPLNFSTASTLLSIISFTILAIGVGGQILEAEFSIRLLFNPLIAAKGLISEDLADNFTPCVAIATSFLALICICVIKMRINPVWSRY